MSGRTECGPQSEPEAGDLVAGVRTVAEHVVNGAMTRALIQAAYDRVWNLWPGARSTWGDTMRLIGDGWDSRQKMDEGGALLGELCQELVTLSRTFQVPGVGKARAFASCIAALQLLTIAVHAVRRRAGELAIGGADDA